MKRIIPLVLCVAFLSFGKASFATVIPSWFDQNDFDFSFVGVLGRTDIDLVSNASGVDGLSVVMNNLSIAPGREWFAWISADQQNQVALSSWDGINLAVPREQFFIGFNQLEFDISSSPLGPGAPAINGVVLPDGGVHICIGSVTDPNCAYRNTTQPNPDVNYTFFLKFAPIPEPTTFALFGLGLFGLGVARRRRISRSWE